MMFSREIIRNFDLTLDTVIDSGKLVSTGNFNKYLMISQRVLVTLPGVVTVEMKELSV